MKEIDLDDVDIVIGCAPLTPGGDYVPDSVPMVCERCQRPIMLSPTGVELLAQKPTKVRLQCVLCMTIESPDSPVHIAPGGLDEIEEHLGAGARRTVEGTIGRPLKDLHMERIYKKESQ